LTEITLYDIYRAVDCVEGEVFYFHENPNPACPVGGNIHAVLDNRLTAAQTALENSLKQTSLADLTKDLRNLLGG